MEHLVHEIDAVFDENSRVLVLGTFPSPKSRESGFFYGNPQNRFWKVLAELFDEPIADTVERKRCQLLRHHIALWDVLASCSIEGASDASIADARPNDLRRILDAAPIEAVFCNGSKAAELYGRFCLEQTGMPCVKLPSTSPANASFSLGRLVGEWKALLPHVHGFEPPVLDVPDVVALEQAIDAAGTSLAELMDRAGTYLAHRVLAHCSLGGTERIAILCGSGNNGGDGWVAARELLAAGHEVTLVTRRAAADLKAEPARSTACAVEALPGFPAPIVNPDERGLAEALDGAGIIIDAILGTGFAGDGLRAPYDMWIAAVNERRAEGATIIAADVPSGLSAQTGAATDPCISADETVTMIVPKPALTDPRCGNVTTAAIAYIEPHL